ncbi:hypothetical protein L226DRAFT_557464 [Lentinus tigrinus ALCF2SS1-7]|uniref:Vacuolar import and degradation protein 21 n=1 Tax=Lentinus tigrinus ALCF2SS1-6 TaxID=1328759 RepID=A0A5C2T129_9APHY|nr:hypothetical protein L227DRAFT_597557 [Lentinus tigrinus ALCF2SS1-6]RPD80268.1 hypothetical protein L226DRAFT_557464 [Lentinus tigrinus ALCF2SS1-7]
MAPSAENTAASLVEARVMQLQQISKRRNDLLREMYQLIQKRDNLGSVIDMEDDFEEDGLQGFLERFDLQKFPETGHISNLLEDEVALHDTPPEYSPVGGPELQLAPEPVSEGVPHLVLDSPMSEPPASPPTETREEKEKPCDVETSQSEVPMEVDEAVPAPPAEQPAVSPPRADASHDISSPELSQEAKTAPQSPVPTQEEVHLTEGPGPVESSPTPERLPTPFGVAAVQETLLTHSPTTSAREPSTSRLSPPREERSPSHASRLAEDESSAVKVEPLDDEVMEVSETQTQIASSFPTQGVESWTPAASAPTQISKDRSEDQIMDILGPSQPRSSPAPVVTVAEDHNPAITYSIPLPAIEPSLTFSLPPGAEELIGFEESSEPPAPFGPDPPYELPPANLLPMEFSRRKMSKRKRDKEKGEIKEWQPMPLNKWAAVMKANPVHARLSRAPKALSTRDWSIGIKELRLLRVFERIEKLKEDNAWGFRQPRKQRGLGGLNKTHWDYLLDEMKWMRTDFREERRWKIALARMLALAVVEWHEAGSSEERVRQGIVVLWKRPPPEDTEMADAGEGDQADGPFTQDTDENGVESRETGTPMDGYASDDESEDEQDKDAIDSLEPASALEDALQQLEDQANVSNSQSDGVTLKPKIEEIEDLTALKGRGSAADRDENAMDIDRKKPSQPEMAKPADPATSTSAQGAPGSHPGLKSSSKNPILGMPGREGEVPHGKTKHKINQFAAVREHIVYSDVNKLFVDLDDLDLVKSMSELSTDEPPAASSTTITSHAPYDLAAIFPDLQPYAMLEVAPTPEYRKKSERKSDKDDPNRRAEDATYTKLVPVNKFMFVKPALIGTVKPATYFKDGHWTAIEPTPVFADVEVPPARPIDENLCSLFEGTGNKPNIPASHPMLMPAPPRDVRKRNADHHNEAVAWTPVEDGLLKQAVERYPYNWSLIAETFNSLRVTISTDKRTPWECLERWKEKFSAQARAEAAEEHSPAAASSSIASHMTTRKRTASQALASGSGSTHSATPNEPRKRRRHVAIHETLRKAAKRREAVQKSNAAPRQKASVVHDTHGQFTKLPQYTPAELSRMKADKEARDAHELFIRSRKNDELSRQHAIRESTRVGPNAQSQPPQMLPQGATPNGVPRTANGVSQAQIAQQMRAQPQVGISQSQQQRMAAHLANTRMSPPHISATQAANLRVLQAQMQAQAQAQPQVQAGQGQAQVPAPVSNASAALTAAAPALSAAHLSPSFAARATSSSPGVPQQSPPLPAASPVNANAVQRPPSVPGQPVQGVPVNPMLHMPNMSNMANVAAAQYYMQMQNLQHGLQGRVTPEQIQALLAQQMRQQQQQQQQQPQQYAHAHAHAQAQNPQNPNFPHQ